MQPVDPLVEFRRRVRDVWLPAFCNDPHRQLALDGFRESSIQVSAVDASDCLFAMDHGLVVDSGGGRYRAANHSAFEQLFWEGHRTKSPRSLTLWLEPVITFAALARLHRDHRWPAVLLGTQSPGGAFDLIAQCPSDPARYRLLGEIKKSTREVDQLRTDLERLSAGVDDADIRVKSKRKWEALLAAKAPILWLVGPAGHSIVMQVDYPAGGKAVLSVVAHDALDHEAAVAAPLPQPGAKARTE
jgi:hypothetical protein